MTQNLKIGLVSISDRASQGIYEDKGIPSLKEWLCGAITTPFMLEARLIADEQDDIMETLIDLVDYLLLPTYFHEIRPRPFPTLSR